MKYKKIKQAFLEIILDEERRSDRQLFYLELLLGIISTVMSAINIFTHKQGLLLSTGCMAVLSFANACIINKGSKNRRLARIIFSIKVFLLFSYFIIFGGTEGFSTIWLLLVPACGMFAFGRKNGVLLSAVFLVEMVILFNTPLRDTVLQCEYTASFLLRFPVVYCCFFAVGYFLEYVRELTYGEMNRLQKEAKMQSLHDALTGLYNRLGFDRAFESAIQATSADRPISLLILDSDAFKAINDCYGHDIGDRVLKIIAERISEIIGGNGMAARWGGDEFAVLFFDAANDEWETLAEQIRASVSQPIQTDGFEICATISIGGACSDELSALTMQNMIILADKRMYQSKAEGRNRCICR